MADAADLKSAEGFLLYGFESRLRHHCFADGWHETFCPLGTLHTLSRRGKEIARLWCFEAHVLACDGVADVEFPRVQHLTLRRRINCPIRSMASVYGIADDGASERRHVHSYLVCPSGENVAFHK